MYSHISPSTRNITERFKSSGADVVQKLSGSVCFGCVEVFFSFCGNFEWHSRIVGIWGSRCFFLSDMWVVRGLNSILLKCCVKQWIPF